MKITENNLNPGDADEEAAWFYYFDEVEPENTPEEEKDDPKAGCEGTIVADVEHEDGNRRLGADYVWINLKTEG